MKKYMILSGLLIVLLGTFPVQAGALTISNVRAENMYSSGAQIKWTTSTAADGKVYYGTSSGHYPYSMTGDCYGSSLVTEHCVNLTNLLSGTVYYYKVESTPSGGTPTVSAEYRFTAGSSGTWSSSSSSTSTTTSTSTDSTNYNSSGSSTSDSSTSGGSSSGASTSTYTAPSAPSGAAVARDRENNVGVTWTDNSSNEREFRVYARKGTAWESRGSAPENTTNFLDRSVPDGTYDYIVVACNAGGCSPMSNTARIVISSLTYQSQETATTSPTSTSSATTSESNDSVTPFSTATSTTEPVSERVYVYNVRAENIHGSGAQIKWDTNSASNSKVSYGTESGQYRFTSENRCDGGGATMKHCVNLTHLLPATKYFFRAESKSATDQETSSGELEFKSAVGESYDLTPPSITSFGHTTDPDGSLRTGVTFSEPIDPTTLNTANVYVIEASSAGKVDGTLTLYDRGVSWRAVSPTPFGMAYKLVVKDDVKDRAGNRLSQEYLSATFAAKEIQHSTTTTPYPSVNETVRKTETAPTLKERRTLSGTGTLKGKVIGSNAEKFPHVAIHLRHDASGSYRNVVTDKNGTFDLTLPAGSYSIDITVPHNRPELSKPETQTVTILPNEERALELSYGRSVKTIEGKIVFSNGKPVQDAEVGAYSKETGRWTSTKAASDGSFTLLVSGGSWQIGARPTKNEDWSLPSPYPEVTFLKEPIAESKSVLLSVPVHDVTVTVKVLTENGTPISEAGVIVDTTGARGAANVNRFPPHYGKTGADGTAEFTLRPGEYFVRAHIGSRPSLLPPDEKTFMITSGETKLIELIAVRKESDNTVTIHGNTTLEDGTGHPSFIWAWSEKGASIEGRSDASGAFQLVLAKNQKWHLGAGTKVQAAGYKSSELILDTERDVERVELVLIKYRETIPETIRVESPATQPIVASTNDGAKVELPAEATKSKSTVHVEIAPTVEAPSQAAAQVVSTVYDITVKDSAGKEVKELEKEIEIVMPYDENELKKQGVTEDTIVPSYFDEVTGAWVKLDNYTIDKEKNVIVARVKHLTRFAIIAAADVTPPQGPQSLVATALGAGKVLLSWKNQARDVDHAKIYRSAKAGSLGTIIAPEVLAETYTDSISDTTPVYYYAVRLVDPAGNESSNNDQVSVKIIGRAATVPAKTAVAATAKSATTLIQNLALGSTGSEVLLLQKFLKAQGMLSQQQNGTFDNATKNAVVSFQEKYAAEILAPAGLSKGSGFVGAATRAKINSLLGKIVPAASMIFDRNLAVGSRGADVSKLQEVLIKEGVFPSGEITGYFGSLTKEAVIRFQEKYYAEILAPAGLSKGSGFVGAGSRLKLNALLHE